MPLEFLEKARNKEAWERFKEIGLPTKQTETYRYVRLSDLYNSGFSVPKISTTEVTQKPATLVFVNGNFVETLSQAPKGIVAIPLSKAMNTYGSFLNNRLNKLLKEEKDPFAALNGAYFAEGLFLYVPPKYICEPALRIVHVLVSDNQTVHVTPRIHICLGKESSLKVILDEKSSPSVWVNGLIDCALEESASLHITKLSHYHESSHHLWALRATLKAKSLLKSYSVTNGASTSREDYSVKLQGERAEACLNGVWSLKEASQHHVNIWMEHEEPSCISLQKFKGVLEDTSRSSFEGKIYVRQKAQKTQAYQMNNNLILGKRATANSKPNLEIFADDVKASHGSTVGQIDPEHLFYLRARGIPNSLAKRLLVQGFIKEILDELLDPIVRAEAEHVVL